MPLPSQIQNLIDQFSQGLASALAGTTPVAPTPAAPARWYWPTATETIAFAKRIGWTPADLDGDRQANTSGTTPAIPACDGTPADAMAYAKFGFTPDGHRSNWPSAQRDGSRRLCDKVWDAPTPQAAEGFIIGSGGPGVEPDLDYTLIMTCATTGGGLMGTPRLDIGAFTDVSGWLAYWMSATTPGPTAPGPGVA